MSSTLIAEQVFPDAGPSTVQFEIRYDRCHIQINHTYSIRGNIRDPDGQLLFINDTAYDMLTQGNPNTINFPLVPA